MVSTKYIQIYMNIEICKFKKFILIEKMTRRVTIKHSSFNVLE